jgi:hypothetical protein
MKPDSFQTHQHKTNRLTPDSRRSQTAKPYHRGHYSHVCISCDNSGYRQILITNFQHCMNGALAKSSVTDIGYYFRSGWLVVYFIN